MKLILISILVAICHEVSGVTYYVSNSGDDTSSGLSVATAFETLQHASDLVVAGDSVWVLPGEYAGFYLETSGWSEDRIVFHAENGVNITAPNQTTDDGINLEGASFITIEGFNVTGMPRAGIRSVINDHVIIQHNFCTQNGMWGILTGFSEDILIQYNECSFSEVEHGIYFSNSADNPVIRYNTCHDNNANGIHMNADANLEGDGIISNAIVTHNILYNNGEAGGSAINCDGVQDSYIANNLAYNNHASGISLYQIDAAAPCHGTSVVNNTILQPSDGRWALNISGGATGIIVFNNILLSDHTYRGSITCDLLSLETLICNHNITTDRMTVDDGDNVISLAEWQQVSGQDSDSFIAEADDLFMDPSIQDYSLLTGSAAINAGVSTLAGTEAPGDDLQGNLRPQGAAWDIGCYEMEGPAGLDELGSIRQVSWFGVPPSAEVWIYDLGGRLMAHEYRKQFHVHVLTGLGVNLLFVARLSDDTIVSGKLPVFQQ